LNGVWAGEAACGALFTAQSVARVHRHLKEILENAKGVHALLRYGACAGNALREGRSVGAWFAPPDADRRGDLGVSSRDGVISRGGGQSADRSIWLDGSRRRALMFDERPLRTGEEKGEP